MKPLFKTLENYADIGIIPQLKTAKQNKNLTAKQIEEHEVLERFLDHQKRSANDQMISATVSMISGTLTVIGGAFTISGILAPVGGALTLIATGIDIGYGLIGARKLKRSTRKQAVDEALKVESTMKKLREKSQDAKLIRIFREKSCI